jgi:replicative DNA helicase
MESDIRLETIFLSITKDNIIKLTDLQNLKELDITEKSDINKLIYLTNQVESSLSIETLKKEFPSLYFDGIDKIESNKELDDYIRLYISKKKNLAASKKLLEIASNVKTNGLDEFTIQQLTNLTKSDVVSIEHDDIEDKILEIYKNKINTDGIKTSIKAVDEATGGLQPGSLATVLGFTGSFKTTWALNMAYNAIQDGKNVLYLSLEVTKEHIYFNLLSRHSSNNKFKTHIEHLDLKHKALSEDDYKYLEDKIYPDFKKSKGKVYIVDETELEAYSFYTLENKFREIENLAIEKTGHGIDMLVVDHAQLLKFDASMKGIGQETNVVNAYVSFFRQCCLNWVKSGRQISVLILSQASREGWKEAVRNEGKYRLTALAEANELERASSLVLSVYSSDTLKQIKAAKVQILKNRDGQAWSEPMEVFVDPAYYVFGDSQSGLSPTPEFNLGNFNDLIDSSNEVVNDIVSSSAFADLNSIDFDL